MVRSPARRGRRQTEAAAAARQPSAVRGLALSAGAGHRLVPSRRPPIPFRGSLGRVDPDRHDGRRSPRRSRSRARHHAGRVRLYSEGRRESEFPNLELTEADVVSTWSGVRPVIASGSNVDPSKETRDSLILEENGLITVTGGKLTTFRSTALQRSAASGRSPSGTEPGARGDAALRRAVCRDDRGLARLAARAHARAGSRDTGTTRSR